MSLSGRVPSVPHNTLPSTGSGHFRNREAELVRNLYPVASFAGVVLTAIVVSIGALSFAAATVSSAVKGTPVRANVRPSYVAPVRESKPQDFNIAMSVPVIPVAAIAPLAAPTAVSGFTHIVAVESLRVRSGPSRIAQQLFALKGGSPVTVSRSERGWVMITAEGGRSGWVYGKMLRTADPQ